MQSSKRMRAGNDSINYVQGPGLGSSHSKRNNRRTTGTHTADNDMIDSHFLVVAKDLARALQNAFGSSSEDDATVSFINDDSTPHKTYNNKFYDVQLLSSDGITYVPACRFVLAARSRVLQQMLYGNFKEAKSSTICLMGYDSCILHSIVYFCTFDQLRLFLSDNNKEEYIRRLVQLGQAADYLELPYLMELVDDKVRRLMAHYPPLACAVFDEAIEATNAVAILHQSSSLSSSSVPVEESPRENLNFVAKASRRSYAKESNVSLYDYALRFIECRPYSSLDCDSSEYGGIGCIHSPYKLEIIMKDSSISAGELFLFQMLERWYEIHARNAIERDNADGTSKNILTLDACYDVAKRCSTHYIRFQNIEPNHMLLSDGIIQQHILKYSTASQNSMKSIVSSDQIFAAVAQQALRSSKDGIWRIMFRQGHIPYNSSSGSTSSSCNNNQEVERILVEGAGNKEANGMYYRITAGLNLSNGNLYSKRETSYGQSIVYTLSCCTISIPANTNQEANTTKNINKLCFSDQEHLYNNDDIVPEKVTYFREYRIFSSQFLTYHAVRNLDTLQSTSDFSPLFQPVLQVIDIVAPDETNLQIPTPIRIFYRVRLSDSELHMTGTFASELSTLFERNEVTVHCVIKVLEYGLYQVSSDCSDSSETNERSTTGIHVIKASVVTTAPLHPFGEPFPLEVYNNRQHSMSSLPVSLVDGVGTMTFSDDCTHQSLQNLYICRCPIENKMETDVVTTSCDFVSSLNGSNIPRSGWTLGDHGIHPVPTCTWIPVVKRTRDNSSSNNSNKESSRKQT